MTNNTEQQAVPVAQEQESALATAFYLLDALAGEGLSQTCDDGRTIEADDTVHALCSAFYMEPDVGWYRDLAAELAPLPCKSGEGAEAIADAVASALAKYAVAYTHVTLTDMSTAGRSWKVHETGHGNPFEHGVWLGEFDTKEAANAFCADLRRSAAIKAARAALTPDATQTREAELVAVLRALVTAAAEYQEAAQSCISDTRYDEDGNLAARDAELSVVALPNARAALNARGGA